MPSHFTLRMQFGPHEDPGEVAGWLLDLVDRAPVDEIMVFFFGEELNTGYPTPEEITYWIERTRPWRQALTERDVRLSLNIWQTLLHRDGARVRKPGQDWQVMVGAHGEQTAVTVCPLDPGWRAYYDDLLRRFAPEGFRVFWVEDDFRLHNHGPIGWGGCFCPLHVAEFNRRTGLQATREEIVRNCTAPGEPHPWRQLWLEMWDDTQRELLSRWRAVVEPSGARLGLMSSSMEAHSAEGRDWAKWWQALSGDKPPIHRPHFWTYSDTIGPALPDAIAHLQQNRALEPEGTEVGPEIECYNYSRWHKSYRQIGAQTALAHVLGATNLNISLYDFLGNRPDDDPTRADFLRRWRPVCDYLTDEFPPTLRSVGVGLPWSQEMAQYIRTEQAGDWSALECPHRQWAPWLGALGQAFAMGAQPMVNSLAGPVLWSFSEDGIRDWLTRGVLLDPTAAEILLARGLGDLIGVHAGRWVSQHDLLYSLERTSDSEFGLRVGAQMSQNLIATLWQGELLEGVRVVSELCDPQQRPIGHGLCLFENALGGRVALVPWRCTEPFFAVCPSAQRWPQLTKTLDWLARGRSLGRVEGGPWLVPQFLTDGSVWRGAIWNVSPDDLTTFTVHPPAGMGELTSATHITAAGDILPAEIHGNRIVLHEPLQQWEPVVLR